MESSFTFTKWTRLWSGPRVLFIFGYNVFTALRVQAVNAQIRADRGTLVTENSVLDAQGVGRNIYPGQENQN